MQKLTAIIGKDLYRTEITSGNNSIIADEPLSDGGKDEGFSPFSLLASSLAACTAITLRMYADRKNWDLESCEVNITVDQYGGKTIFFFFILFVGNLDEEQKQRLLKIADKCFIHKVLTNPIEINTRLI